MPENRTKDQKKNYKDWTLPGNSLSQDEFLDGIQKAEEGPFMTFEEHHAKMDKWIQENFR
ncbi:MAG TPA: hypothetical protein VIK10_04995 [Prolixibacteraceae bacterium]